MKLDPKNIDAIIFDFDGVLTNDRVIVGENGEEFVTCNRRDGLAFDILRKNSIKTYILSTEKNKVVSARAKKLQVEAIQGSSDKLSDFKQLCADKGLRPEHVVYIGNDLNDYQVMNNCAYSFCPADSHPEIKKISTGVLQSNGGDGVARELVENVLGLSFISF